MLPAVYIMPRKPGLPYVSSFGGATTIRTSFQSASSSSARMTGSDVFEPCPISAAGDMIEIRPSDAIVTHGLKVAGDAADADEIAPPGEKFRSTKANERPAAPIIRDLRVMPASDTDRRSMINPPSKRVLRHAGFSHMSHTGKYARSCSRR